MILQFVPIINKYTINTSYGQYYVIRLLNPFKSSSILYIVKEMMLTMYNIDYKELGKRIRAERRKQYLTQEKLAEMANISA